MRKTNRDKRIYYRYATVALLIVFLVSTALFFLKMWERNQGRFPVSDIEDTSLEYNGKVYTQRENIETFLVLGLDKFDGASTSDSYNNDKQSDFLMLFVFDNEAKTCATIHINRDTMANVSVLGVAGDKVATVTQQIALAHTYGNGGDVSCRNAAESVSDLLLNVKVDHYLSVTMDAVSIFNDLVGGVEVTVLSDFTGIDDTLVKGEKVTLLGQQALTYVRTRYGLEDSSNKARMERQRQYLDAFLVKIQECIEKDENFLGESSLELAEYIVSDRSVTQLQKIADKFAQYEVLEISDIKGETKVGEKYMEFYPDEDSIKELVIELFYEPKN